MDLMDDVEIFSSTKHEEEIQRSITSNIYFHERLIKVCYSYFDIYNFNYI
jgi:hypothetical protein